ncbi:apolipoprotein A-Ib isoform X2 [Colossoma macropomum]|nr:apolipoprotein A-Ib isoform X2 [Colossoma macropomum]
MKFVALALAILLAAGCQARSMQADAPTQYEQIRSAVVTYLGQVKETAQKAINRLDDAEYKELKDRLTLSLTRIEKYLESASESLRPVRETIGPQVIEAFAALREKVEKDVEDLRTELAPKREALREVVKKHIDQYREKLEPLLKEYAEKHHEQMEYFRSKFEPVLKELRELIKTNVEETKSKLTPIVEVLVKKGHERLEELKHAIEPYIQEYREQAGSTFTSLRDKYESGELQKKISDLVEEIKPQLEKIAESVHRALKE